MLTIFTVPKPFVGHVGVIQRNAIRSWLGLQPRCEVVLVGQEPGTQAVAAELGVRHIPQIRCSEYGTPFLDDVFARAAEGARFDLLCYVNADIILPSTFLGCVQRVPFPTFLMVGQRLDLDILEEIALDDPAERARAEDLIREAGVLHPPGGSDYFVFPKGALGTLPPFLVGRPGWDNWMIFRATQLGVPVVDASGCSLVVHQNHDYQHVPGGTVRYEGPEADYNRGLMGGWDEFMTPEYAGWRLTGDRLERWPWWTKSSKIGTRVFAASHPRLRFLVPAVRRWLTARERRAEKRAG